MILHPRFSTIASRKRAGFTLVEVLAAILLISIVLPGVMRGISLSMNAASDARHRNEAAGLAEGKLAEIVATNQWQNAGGLSGDFGTDWPTYRWEMTSQPWTQDNTISTLQQLDLRVIWQSRGRDDSLTVSTLGYQRTTAQ